MSRLTSDDAARGDLKYDGSNIVREGNLGLPLLFILLGAVCGTEAGAGCSGGGKGGGPGSGGTSAASGGATGAGGGGPGGQTGGVSGNDAGSADAASCACFLKGTWEIDNSSPCLVTLAGDGGPSALAISTVVDGDLYNCPSDISAAPTAPWSTDTLTTDCAGHYRLCYAIKAGAGSNPQPDDCVVAQVCAEADYTTANQPQSWPNLPGWISADSAMACAMSFTQGGGYGEKSVTGTPAGCSPITAIIGIVTYCPLDCSDPNAPSCTNCMPGERDGGF